MSKLHCRIGFDQQREHSKFLIRRNAEYWLDPHGKLYEQTSYGINKRYLVCIICLVAVFSLALVLCGYIVHAHSGSASQAAADPEASAGEAAPVSVKTHMETTTIYDRCSNDYLSFEDAWALYEQSGPYQLQFCINLMYARHGYVFKEGSRNDIYFNQQEWYQNLEKEKVTYENLNAFEQANTNLLVKILEGEGYR